MKNYLRIFAILTLSLGFAGLSFAQTFSDVQQSDWFYNYVESLSAQGVVEASANFRPSDNLTRAEMVEMIIKSIDGLASFEVPSSATFTDVPISAESFAYVEAANALGIVNGYADASGNLTGQLGPNDPITRAATAKILVNAYNIPSIQAKSRFPDVKESAWYHPFVVRIQEEGIIDGYENGNFGPADNVTRAQIAKMIAIANNSVNQDAEASLEVSLSQNQPSATTLPLGTYAPLLKLDFKAIGQDVQLSQITLTRGGVGDASDWEGVYIAEGYQKKSSEYSINSSTNKVTIPINLQIDAGETLTLTAFGKLSSSASAGSNHYFYLESINEIKWTGAEGSADLPASGKTLTTGGITVNTVTISPGSLPREPRRFRHDEIATFQLQAGSASDLAFNAITLTQGGTFSSAKMTDCTLDRNGDLLAGPSQFNGDELSFTLDDPYLIPQGQNRSFSARCTIGIGRTTETVHVYLEEEFDLITSDLNYGNFPASVSNNFKSSDAPSINLN